MNQAFSMASHLSDRILPSFRTYLPYTWAQQPVEDDRLNELVLLTGAPSFASSCASMNQAECLAEVVGLLGEQTVFFQDHIEQRCASRSHIAHAESKMIRIHEQDVRNNDRISGKATKPVDRFGFANNSFTRQPNFKPFWFFGHNF